MGLKPRKVKKGNSKIQAREPTDWDSKSIVISLERVVKTSGYCFSDLKSDHKASFAESIFKRRNASWREIKSMAKHALGFEKISIKAIKGCRVPDFITVDNNTLIAFRYHGKCPMVGYRIQNVFFVLWFDHNFTLYEH